MMLSPPFTLLPPAQVLPYHIVASIAQYIELGAAETPSAIKSGSIRIPIPSKELAPLAAVCQSWRSVVDPLIYRVAAHCTSSGKPYIYTNTHLPKLSVAVERQKQHLVRQLYLFIDFSKLFTAESLLSFMDFVETTCGEMPSVFKLALIPTYSESNYLWHTPSDEEVAALMDISTAMEKFFKCVRHLTPNARIVTASHGSSYRSYRRAVKDHDHAIALLPAMFAERTTQLVVDHVNLSRPQLDKLVPGMLRSISITGYKGPQCHIELIQRHAPWLERLELVGFTVHAIVKLTWGHTPTSTRLYPRLKKLNIASVVGMRTNKMRQPTVDPFPALEVLDCQTCFPFTTPVVLEGGQSHLRVLKLRMDTTLFGIMESNGLLRSSSYKKLEIISLGWAERSAFGRQEHSERMLLKSFEVGAQTQVLYANRLTIPDFDVVLPKIQFTNTLRVLDFQETALTIAQAVELLSGFPKLREASLFLREAPGDRSKRMPTPEEVAQFNKRFIDCQSSVMFLDICKTQFTNSRRSGEYIVMMTDVMPSITRVRIKCSTRTRSSRVRNGIKFALQRSIYKNKRVQDVQFAADE
ncbi:hypothetical protein GGI03_000787 [Coemansia sp. RSA 2337]|nr:hypothetical protein GGI14_004249 [Coemansia sp. S680]KAJ2061228.1 hypothetical protein GGI08_002893 [Coemansia sp. S2]KAJ2076058.1 hypothetical protein GGH13_000165 [Coemansia sp. S155-1]KAJ2103350.1 hypothetical protein GGI09_000709 [Coemansia sp. S100]KAJ2108090.1 hypothetical protein GGI16_001270 [Coemansia sp. S142-1]KAJ2115015.1 hypothetical protein IW146_002639 [Coemansia sp. RSA 922]KAJ2344851.1 hypothetical protein GGH92_004307 [Coemansia sp. RSA 2673]KAJ2468769.1 hypothetical pr